MASHSHFYWRRKSFSTSNWFLIFRRPMASDLSILSSSCRSCRQKRHIMRHVLKLVKFEMKPGRGFKQRWQQISLYHTKHCLTWNRLERNRIRRFAKFFGPALWGGVESPIWMKGKGLKAPSHEENFLSKILETSSSGKHKSWSAFKFLIFPKLLAKLFVFFPNFKGKI